VLPRAAPPPRSWRSLAKATAPDGSAPASRQPSCFKPIAPASRKVDFPIWTGHQAKATTALRPSGTMQNIALRATIITHDCHIIRIFEFFCRFSKQVKSSFLACPIYRDHELKHLEQSSQSPFPAILRLISRNPIKTTATTTYSIKTFTQRHAHYILRSLVYLPSVLFSLLVLNQGGR